MTYGAEDSCSIGIKKVCSRRKEDRRLCETTVYGVCPCMDKSSRLKRAYKGLEDYVGFIPKECYLRVRKMSSEGKASQHLQLLPTF